MIIEQAINKVLEKHGYIQTNLASASARKQIVKEIASLINLNKENN